MSFTFAAYDSVRALLGVSAKELPDTVLSDEIYNDQLQMELLGVDPDIHTYYDTALASSTTAAELNFLASIRIFSAYAMAKFCLPGLPLFSPKSVTDGKAGFSRYSDSPYKQTITRVESGHQDYLVQLESALSVYTGGSAETPPTTTITGSSVPTFDPITGG